MIWRATLLSIVVVLVPSLAAAHPTPFSYLDIHPRMTA